MDDELNSGVLGFLLWLLKNFAAFRGKKSEQGPKMRLVSSAEFSRWMYLDELASTGGDAGLKKLAIRSSSEVVLQQVRWKILIKNLKSCIKICEKSVKNC